MTSNELQQRGLMSVKMGQHYPKLGIWTRDALYKGSTIHEVLWCSCKQPMKARFENLRPNWFFSCYESPMKSSNIFACCFGQEQWNKISIVDKEGRVQMRSFCCTSTRFGEWDSSMAFPFGLTRRTTHNTLARWEHVLELMCRIPWFLKFCWECFFVELEI